VKKITSLHKLSWTTDDRSIVRALVLTRNTSDSHPDSLILPCGYFVNTTILCVVLPGCSVIMVQRMRGGQGEADSV